MTKLYTALLLIATAALAGASAPDFLPLEAGNQWTYRSANGETLRITVGTPLMNNGNVYYKVTGYAVAPMYLRRADNGDIYSLDQDTGVERILTRYESDGVGLWYDTSISGCEQGAQVQSGRRETAVPVGRFNGALEIRYRSYGCADVGFLGELYLENVGLLQRTVTTIAGPRTFDLEYARVGAVRLHAQPGTTVRVGVARSYVTRKAAEEIVELPLSLRLSVDRSLGAVLRYTTSQQFDVLVRNQEGEVVYRWSDDVAFAQGVPVPEQVAGEVEHRLNLQLRTREGAALPDGIYTIEAWFTTSQKQFSSATTIQLVTG
jgi:hypothetical protein